MFAPEHGHDPVMLRQVLELLNPKPGETALDCTVGRGGHAAAILPRIAPGGTLLALDADPQNLKYARERINAPADQVRFFHANFAEAADALREVGLERVDCLLADFGVSTNQLLQPAYGLSFSEPAPLDMRLDPRIKATAADLLRDLSEKQIADLIFQNAQERFSRRIARKIVQTRSLEPIRNTDQLARLVRSVLPPAHGKGIDPATRTFQALRMAVNQEVEHLQALLESVPDLINPDGRAVFISFHSGEDRLVKQATRQWREQGICEVLTNKPLEPDELEMQRNPRSRSAKLRAVKFKF